MMNWTLTMCSFCSELSDISSIKKENYDEFAVRMLPAGEDETEVRPVKKRKKESMKMNIVWVFIKINFRNKNVEVTTEIRLQIKYTL